VLGVLAIGGLPALALTLAQDTPAGTSREADADREAGPPPWAHGKAHGHDKAGKDDRVDKDKQKDKDRDGTPGWMRHDGQVPPGWAKHHPGKVPHGWEMRAWARCVADAATALPDGATLDPESACGERPSPPRHGR
jgi:hypothetical protein